MSFLTEYFDNYRQHKIVKTRICDPSLRFPKLEGTWYEPRKSAGTQQLTPEEIEQFTKDNMRSLRGQSTYFNDICAHLDQSFKTRPPVPKVRPDPCKKPQPPPAPEDQSQVELPKTLSMKDAEVMKKARALYERDMDEPTLEPLQTHFKILGYSRPHYYKTGLTEYQESIGRVAYELVRDDRVKRRVPNNGNKPVWGYPPENPRQPLLDTVPLDGERIY